jgi:hypothetical protein
LPGFLGDMTASAVQVLMPASKRKIGVPVVVKPNFWPLLFLVTALTLVSKRAQMNIVRLMTRTAGTFGPFESLIRVTLATAQSGMGALEWEIGFGVVKAPLQPAGNCVTTIALLPQVAFMHILTGVAVPTFRRGFAIGFARLVTTLAGHRRMRSLEREVGKLVGKGQRVKLDKSALPSSMLRVAQATIAAGNTGFQAMESLLQSQVLFNILVAAQAPLVFTPLTIPDMATVAVLVPLGMRLAELARTKQAFETEINTQRTGLEYQGQQNQQSESHDFVLNNCERPRYE